MKIREVEKLTNSAHAPTGRWFCGLKISGGDFGNLLALSQQVILNTLPKIMYEVFLVLGIIGEDERVKKNNKVSYCKG